MPQKDPPGAATYYEHQLRSVLNQILCSLRRADDLIDRTGSTFRQSGEGKTMRKRIQLARTALMMEVNPESRLSEKATNKALDALAKAEGLSVEEKAQ